MVAAEQVDKYSGMEDFCFDFAFFVTNIIFIATLLHGVLVPCDGVLGEGDVNPLMVKIPMDLLVVAAKQVDEYSGSGGIRLVYLKNAVKTLPRSAMEDTLVAQGKLYFAKQV